MLDEFIFTECRNDGHTYSMYYKSRLIGLGMRMGTQGKKDF